MFKLAFAPLAVGASITCAAIAAAVIPQPSSFQLDETKSLLITHLGTVDDARALGSGPWSFGTVMRNLAGNQSPEAFIEEWITTLTQPVAAADINGDPNLQNNVNGAASKRTAFANFFDAWRDRSPNQVLDLDTAPFRLCAVVHRPDLLDMNGAVVTSAGEARLVYCMIDPEAPAGQAYDQATASVGARQALVIFEFGIPASSCEELQDWNERWSALSSLRRGNPAQVESFNAALQDITDDFILSDADRPGLNGSLLNQYRLNSFALETSDILWDLREWRLKSETGNPQMGVLSVSTTAQTPSFRFIRQSARRTELADWLTANKTQILDGTHEVGLNTGVGADTEFLGGRAINDTVVQGSSNLPPGFPTGGGSALNQDGTLWWAPGYAPVNIGGNLFYPSVESANVRHEFALQTCSGCHFWESLTSARPGGPSMPSNGGLRFRMISERNTGFQSLLSPFLTGTGDFVDPVNPLAQKILPSGGRELVPVTHNLDDLENRKTIMNRILALDCSQLGFTTSELQSIDAAMGSRVH